MKCTACGKTYMTAQQFQRHRCPLEAQKLSPEALADKLIETGAAGGLTRDRLIAQLSRGKA